MLETIEARESQLYKRNLRQELENSFAIGKKKSDFPESENGNRAEVLDKILDLQTVVIDRKKAKMVDCQNSIDENRNSGTDAVRNQNLAAELANLVMEIDVEVREHEKLTLEKDALGKPGARHDVPKIRFM